MGLSLNACLLLYYITRKGIATGLNPILDKTEIGEGENFTVTCDISRVTTYSRIFMLVINREMVHVDGIHFDKMISVKYSTRCNPCIEGDVPPPWKAIFNTPISPRAEEVQIQLINTNSTCEDAGNFSCEFWPSLFGRKYESTQFLSRTALCYVTSTSTLPTETVYSSVNGTDSTPCTEPTTQGSGLQVKSPASCFFFTQVLIFLVMCVM